MRKADCILGNECVLLKSMGILQGKVHWDYKYVQLWFWWFENVQGTPFMGPSDAYIGIDKGVLKFEVMI